MSVTFHFPNATEIQNCINNNPVLNSSYNQQKGITGAIAMLAAQRFADSEKKEEDIKLSVTLMFNDLRKGFDGFTGKNITKIDLSLQGEILSICVEKALRSCARQSA